MAALTFNVANDNLLQIYIKDTEGGADLSAATVTYDLKDSADASVTTGTYAHKTSGSPNTDGQYIFQSVMQESVSLADGDSYTLEVTVDGGTNLTGFGKYAATAADRTENT